MTICRGPDQIAVNAVTSRGTRRQDFSGDQCRLDSEGLFPSQRDESMSQSRWLCGRSSAKPGPMGPTMCSTRFPSMATQTFLSIIVPIRSRFRRDASRSPVSTIVSYPASHQNRRARRTRGRRPVLSFGQQALVEDRSTHGCPHPPTLNQAIIDNEIRLRRLPEGLRLPKTRHAEALTADRNPAYALPALLIGGNRFTARFTF